MGARIDHLRRWSAYAPAVLGIALGAACCAAVVIELGMLGTKPLEYVEGCLLFDAARIRAHLPLYVDPLVGALEYGPPASRYYVPYTPAYAAVASLVPAGAAPVVLRAAGLGAWLALLVGLGARARPSGAEGDRVQGERRAAAWILAAYIAASQDFLHYAACARPDAAALVLAALALTRALSRGRVDPLSAAIFVAAAILKPNVVGLGTGAILADVARRRARAAPAVATALGIAAAWAAFSHWLSDGAWLVHLDRALALKVDASVFWFNVSSYALRAAPPVCAAAWAIRRAEPGDAKGIARGAIAASAALTLIAVGKVGAAANHWMELFTGSLVVVSRLPHGGADRARDASRWVHGLGACAAIAAAVSAAEGLRVERDIVVREAAVIERTRATCLGVPGRFVVSDDPGVEFMLDGRLMIHGLEFTKLIREHRFPVDGWLRDLESDAIACVLVTNLSRDVLERPWSDERPADRFPAEVRRALAERFVLAEEQAEWRIYRRR